jgi:hypothetical protein
MLGMFPFQIHSVCLQQEWLRSTLSLWFS